jgi:hypothetical protein
VGTSRNDASPSTPSWKAVLAVLGKTDVSIELQVREVWRAAAQDRDGALARDLSHPVISGAWELSRQGLPVERALQGYEDNALHVSDVGLAVEFGRRALARCASQAPGATSFPAELFGEVSAYYVARDLPSVVAAKGRVPAVSDAIRLKSSIREFVKSQIATLGEPTRGTRGWKTFVAKATDVLQKKAGRR